MQEAGAGVSTVTTPGERHRTAPSTTALHMLATCDPLLLRPATCNAYTLLSADPCVWMLSRQANYRPLQGVPPRAPTTFWLHDERGGPGRCSLLGLVY